MYLSSLQKFIVLQCFDKGPARYASASVAGGGKVDRKTFRQFYEKQESRASLKYEEGIITNSLERLINKELLIGYGRRTSHKWFITHVKLTNKGIKMAKQVLALKQRKLQF
jgi:hypothetical protein